MHDAHASRAGETSVPLTASAVLVTRSDFMRGRRSSSRSVRRGLPQRSNSPSLETGLGRMPRIR